MLLIVITRFVKQIVFHINKNFIIVVISGAQFFFKYENAIPVDFLIFNCSHMKVVVVMIGVSLVVLYVVFRLTFSIWCNRSRPHVSILRAILTMLAGLLNVNGAIGRFKFPIKKLEERAVPEYVLYLKTSSSLIFLMVETAGEG